MGPGLLWNLTEYVRRLGGVRQDAPPLLHAIQPVLIAGDASGLTTPLRPPSSLVAANGLSGVVGGYPTLVITSRAPGGTYIRRLHSAPGLAAGDGNVWVGVHTNQTASGVGALTPQTLGSTTLTPGLTVETNVGIGTATALQNEPYVKFNDASATGHISLVDLFYIPPGRVLVAQHNSTNVGWNFAVEVEDVPAMVPGA